MEKVAVEDPSEEMISHFDRHYSPSETWLNINPACKKKLRFKPLIFSVELSRKLPGLTQLGLFQHLARNNAPRPGRETINIQLS